MKIDAIRIDKWIYLLAIITPVIAIVLWASKPTIEESLEKIENKIYNVQGKINNLAEERDELRKEKIDIMGKNFRKNNKIENKSTYDEVSYNKLTDWIKSKLWMQYKLGGKWGWSIDCSWLFGAYALYEIGMIDNNTLINHYSAENIRQINEEKYIDTMMPWDFVYLMKNWKANHIMMVADIDWNYISTFEANPEWWVGIYVYRFIQDNHGIYLERNWNVYDFKITTNSLLTARKYIGKFLISSYIPWNWDQINCWGGGCAHAASWLPLKDEYAWKIVACPKQYSIWLNGEPKQKLYIEWHWVVECSDRGWLIVMKGEVNSRGNVSSMNRLDLFAWLGTPKIKRNQTTRKVYLVE